MYFDITKYKFKTFANTVSYREYEDSETGETRRVYSNPFIDEKDFYLLLIQIQKDLHSSNKE